jgi:hypothetical protein
MIIAKSFLHRMQGVTVGNAFDGGDICTSRLDGEHCA